MSNRNASLGDRMKSYERPETGRRTMPLLPVVARLDGRAFSGLTKGLQRPYDKALMRVMHDVTAYLVDETCARIGYTQSDEITLVWQQDDVRAELFFDGKLQKMVSVLAALATHRFQQAVRRHLPELQDRVAVFDCRVFTVPNRAEAANCVLWRELDATKNSISMAARTRFSHGQLQHKTGNEMQAMLLEVGINWNDYPADFKRGAYFQRAVVERSFSADELAHLPPQHRAVRDPTLTVRRSVVRQLSLPPLRKVLNRVDVLFDGAAPRTATAADAQTAQSTTA